MDREPSPCRRRREALKLALNASAGLAVAMIAGRALAQPSAKLSKESVKYTDSGNAEGKDCDDCSQYLPGQSADDRLAARRQTRRDTIHPASMRLRARSSIVPKG